MPIEVTASDSPITVSASGTKIDATVSGGQGPQGPAGPTGPEAELPAGSEGQVLTYVSGEWVGAEPTGGVTSWNDLEDKPADFPPSSHTHVIADVTGLQTALDGKQASGSYAAASHTHAISDVTDLASTLSEIDAAISGKAASSHTHGGGDISFTAYGETFSAGTDSLIANFLWSIDEGDSGAAIMFLEPALQNTFAAVSHAHSAADVTSGTFDIALIPTGTTSTTVCIGNDARLSDARTPTAHNQAWSTITSTPTTRSGYGITDAQKTITSGTAAPTGGSDGDIYLQYT